MKSKRLNSIGKFVGTSLGVVAIYYVALYLWEPKPQMGLVEKINSFSAPYSVTTLDFHPDNRRLVTGSVVDHSVDIWDADSGDLIHSIPLKTGGTVSRVKFSPDGKLLAVGREFTRAVSGGVHLLIYEVESWRQVSEFAPPDPPPVGTSNDISALVFTNDSGAIFVNGYGGRSYGVIYDLVSGEVISKQLFEGSNAFDNIRSAAISVTNNWLVLGRGAPVIEIWSLDKEILIESFQGHDDFSVNGFAINEKGDRLVSIAYVPFLPGGTDSEEEKRFGIRLKNWILSSNGEIREGPRMVGHEDLVLSVELANTEKWVLSSGRDNTVHVFELETGKLIEVIGGFHKEVRVVGAKSSDVFATAAGDNIQIWKY